MSIVNLTIQEFRDLTGKSLSTYSNIENNFQNQVEYVVETNIDQQKIKTLPEKHKETFDPMMEFIVL